MNPATGECMTDLGIRNSAEISELTKVLAGVRITKVDPREAKYIASKLLDFELNDSQHHLVAADRDEIIKYSSARLWTYFKHIIKNENTLPADAAERAIMIESGYLQSALNNLDS